MQRLLELRGEHPDLNVVSWGYPELRERAFRLAEADVAALLGPVPSSRELLSVRFRDVQQVLYAVSRQQPPVGREVRQVSGRKLQANGLSSHVRALLSAGMTLSDRVRQFLARHHDPTFGDGIAERFREEYVAARDEDSDPDGVFMKLWKLVRLADATPALEAAGLAVLAYLFERCDIFEDPEGVAAA